MKCKLCGLDRKLIRAHIIPEFMYENLYNKDHKFYEFSVQDIIERKKIKPFIQTGDFDKKILCEKCDNEKLGKLEKYAKKCSSEKTLIQKKTLYVKIINWETLNFQNVQMWIMPNLNYSYFQYYGAQI